MIDAGGASDHGDLAAAAAPGGATPNPGPQAAAARAAVTRALANCGAALAAWEAGSAAFGRADGSSDLDVVVIATEEPGSATAVLDAIEEELADLTDLVLVDIGASTFGVQRFWQPAQPGDDAPTCMVDACVLAIDSDADTLRELLTVERHGRGPILHDPTGVLAELVAGSTFDPDAHRARIQAELDRVRARHAMFAAFARKELARGRAIDAHAMHHATVVLPLVALLGMVHRPLRFDFALRYLHDELPADVVERLLPIVSPGHEHLDGAIADGIAWIDELVDAIDPDLLPIEQHAAEMRAAFA